MFFTPALLILATSALSAPVPTKRATAPTDVDVLQYALTLEHLENAFYTEFLGKFDAAAFKSAGYPDFLRGRLAQVGEHEAQHVTFLETALKAANITPTAACQYSFPVTDVKSFVATAEILEGVGVTAYLGAAQFIKTPAYLTAAGSILTTEARHNAWINSVGKKAQPWSGAEDTPQTLDQVFSLAAPFITSCPASNPAIPVKAFPALSISLSGTTATLNFSGSTASTAKSLALLSGLSTTMVPINNGKAELPKGLQGTVYAVVSSDARAVSDETTVAGPAILKFDFPSFVGNP